MTITPQTFQLTQQKVVFDKIFVPDQTAWEIVDKDSERAFIRNNHYYMENLTDSRWNIYHNNIPADIGENWMIETSMELLSHDQHGHFGIVWGFDENREYLNRFTVSADGERGVVMHFQKDHQRVFHVNRQLMYICEESHLANHGNGFGYYIEPGLFVRSSYMTVNKLTLEDTRRERFDSLFF